MFWCKGKKDYCLNDGTCEACEACKYADCSGGIDVDDEDVFIGCWISVKDRLPEEMQAVLAIFDDESLAIVWMYCQQWHMVGEPYLTGITHWMPLPEPPKEEK